MHCWARRMSKRLAGRYGYPKVPHNFDVTLHPDRLNQPLRWRRSRRIFVASMGDLFHEDVPLEFILQVYNIAEDAPQHTYLWLTKRSKRALEFHRRYIGGEWLPNIWLGTTIEAQKYVSRIRYLQDSGASIIFVSCEPLLEPVVLDPYLRPTLFRPLDWVICGAESGPGARPMQEAWVRALRNQAVDAGVPFFYKQQIVRGKKVSMPLLDGRVWDQYPKIETHK